MKQWHSEGQQHSGNKPAAAGGGSRRKQERSEIERLRDTCVLTPRPSYRYPDTELDTASYARRAQELWNPGEPSADRSSLKRILGDDAGMSTIEYAMGSLAAAALAAVLYTVVKGRGVVDAIQSIIMDALSNVPG